MKLYMITTKDKYELPLAIADNRTALAKIIGTTPEYVSSQISKKSKGWYCININDDETEIIDTQNHNTGDTK